MIADLDRFVRVLQPAKELGRRYKLSDLASIPRVVILGEPGIGKSTILEREAALEGASVVTVRQLLNANALPETGTLFIDALDQARTRDSVNEKIDALATTVKTGLLRRWRITCRSEDWRGRADLQALMSAGSFDDVHVVQLLPIQYDEALAVLRAIGNDSPDVFLETARANGATGFTESPLMLKLLHDVVENTGMWPETRFNLFQLATDRLVTEVNEERETTPRASRSDLIKAAGIVSLLLLTTGAEGVWRSNRALPLEDETRLISREDFEIEDGVLDDLLDSALFRGEGNVFAPIHRSVAEFLAGRALANTVEGGSDRAAFPISRALSIITDNDRKAPTELRGVHAWFAVHLAQLGRIEDAIKIVAVDPVSALFYGDVASFSTDVRRELLYALPSDDPYFRSQAQGDTAIAGLAGEDLAEDFRAILLDEDRRDHLKITVLDALGGGVPVTSLNGLLEQIAIAESQPEAYRSAALDALLNAAPDRHVEAKRLFDAMSILTPSHDREGLRAKLLSEFPNSMLDAAEIAGLLVGYGSLGQDDLIMRLYSLRLRLVGSYLPEVLDALSDRHPLPWADSYRGFDIEELLTSLFVDAVGNSSELSAAQLLRWARVLAPGPSESVPRLAMEVVQNWMDARSEREIELFEVLRLLPEARSTWIANAYSSICGRKIPYTVLKNCIRLAVESDSSEKTYQILSMVTDILRFSFDEEYRDSYWELYELLENDTRYMDLYERLTVCPIDDYRLAAMDRKREKSHRDDVTRRWRLRRLVRDLSGIREGHWPSPVHQAARHYFQSDDARGIATGLDNVMEMYGDDISEAITQRWNTLSTKGIGKIEIREMGVTHGERRSYETELPSVAGLHLRLEDGEIVDWDKVPLTVLLSVFTQGYHIRDSTVRQSLERSALSSIGHSQSNMDALVEFWSASLTAGAISLCGLSALNENADLLPLFEKHLDSYLSNNADVSIQALREAIGLAGQALDADRLAAIVEAALMETLSEENRGLWLATGIEIDLDRFEDELNKTSDLTVLTKALANNAMGNYHAPLICDDPTTRTARHVQAIKLIGPFVTPSDEMSSGVVTDAMRRNDTLRNAMTILESDSSDSAYQFTAGLLADPSLSQWFPRLRNVMTAQAAKRRDEQFRKPLAADVRASLNGGPPLNAGDLRSIVELELRNQSSSMQTASTEPWKQFWNTDSHGKVTEPRVENICRDRVLERLDDRLQPYRITAAIPEAQRGHGTRADILILCGAGANLPVEVKRHYHADVWTAASTQLQGYANAPQADGFGIYLVLWFGVGVQNTPTRSDRRAAPTTAKELEARLIDDLPDNLKSTTSIIVFDVERPYRAG